MSDEANAPDNDEMKAALRSLDQAKRAAVDAARPPLWLTALATALLAIVLLGGWLLEEGSRSRAGVMGLAILAFLGTWGVHMMLLKRRGLRVRQFPATGTALLFMLVQVVFMSLVFTLTEWLLDKGHDWLPWVSTAIICVTFAVLLHRFPTGEPIRRSSRN